MTQSIVRWIYLVVTVFALGFFVPSVARAEVFEGGTASGEAFLGLYDGEFPVYGVRFGADLAVDWLDQKWNVYGSLARHTRSKTVLGVEHDFSLLMLDFSLGWYFYDNDKFRWFVFAGPGWARAKVDVEGVGSESDGEFTVHVGIGGQIRFADSWYFRPDARVRDGGRRGPDFDDLEVTAGVGYVFGKR